MKKLCLSLLLCLCLGLSLAVPVLAAEAPSAGETVQSLTPELGETAGNAAPAAQQTLGYVTDMAGILSSAELERLTAEATEVSEQYTCGVYIVVVENYKNYTTGSVERCTEDLYHYFDLGLGDGNDGLILLMSMAERDYDLWGYGPFAKYAFTDYGLDQLEEAFLPYFRQNNWSGGFSAYIRGAARLLDAAAQGEPVDYKMATGLKAAIAAGPAALIGFIVCGVFKGQMKTAKERDDADEYVVDGGVRLRVKTDQFINRTRSVQVIESSSGGSRGGGGGGTSHHSGKF